MNFEQRHRPMNTGDLVFRDRDTAQIVRDYASGLTKKHLLLEGPTSSGKSEAARLILKERLFAEMGDAYASIYHGQGFDARAVKTIVNEWNFQMTVCGEAYSVIDEVDFANAEARREIRKLIDSTSYGTLICTTNFVDRLEPAFVSRFRTVTLEVPQARDWHARARQIFHAEGIPLTEAQVERIMSSFSGHARGFIEFIEDACLTLRRSLKQVERKETASKETSIAPVKLHSGGVWLDSSANNVVIGENTVQTDEGGVKNDKSLL